MNWFEHLEKINCRLIDHLYNRLLGLYGERWSRNFRNEAEIENWRNVWGEMLTERKVTPHMIKRGLKNCIEMYDWPPTLPEFIKACEVKARDEVAIKEDNDYLALSNQLGSANSPVAKQEIAKMLEMIKSKKMTVQ